MLGIAWVAHETHAIYGFVYQAYARPSSLFFEDEVLDLKEGVQQGDPLGPLLYSLTLMGLLKCCNSELNKWYLDDATLAGEPSVVLSDFAHILRKGESAGAAVNPAKTKLTFAGEPNQVTVNAFRVLSPEISLTTMGDLTLVALRYKDRRLELSPPLPLSGASWSLRNIDSQDALFLLRHCFALVRSC